MSALTATPVAADAPATALLPKLRALLLEAGVIMQRWAAAPVESVSKADGSPVTCADHAINAFLRAELQRLLPEAGWLSEETRDDRARLEREWVWIVDPLDGTREFVRRIPEVAVSVGLARFGEPVLGGVYNPLSGEGAVAAVGGPQTFWGFNARPSPCTTLFEATASISRTEQEDGSIAPYLALVGHARVVGSVAYKLLRVAAGSDDLTFSVQPKSEWDLCGGVALLHAVGKTYQRFDGAPVRFNRPVVRVPCGAAAGPKALVEALIRAWRAATPRAEGR